MNPSLGYGIYRVMDVARYTQIPYGTVYSWFKTRSVFYSDYAAVEGTFTVSFYDLIDALVASEFRGAGVTMRMVRRAHEKLASILDSPHPFCHRDLYTDGRSIIIRAAEELGTPNLQDAVSKQQLFDAIHKHLYRVAYSELTRLATHWNVAPGVVIDPQIAMGHPVIAGTGVTTYVVRGAYHANGRDRALVASLYGLSASQVESAVNFEDRVRSAA